MKALSIRQPWAWLIVNGHKDIENRTWRTSFRGRVLIHASKGMTRDEYDDVRYFLDDKGIDITLPARDTLERGGVVGIATITDCIHPGTRSSPWHMEDQYGFGIVAAKPMPFVPCKGALGFFDAPHDALTALRSSMEGDLA